jgi:hypothetical protein
VNAYHSVAAGLGLWAGAWGAAAAKAVKMKERMIEVFIAMNGGVIRD